MVERHLLNEIHSKETCHYCKEDIKDHNWDSIFHQEFHYKAASCNNCGKENRIKVDFHGSGHDGWDGNHSWKFYYKENSKDLDLKIKELKKFGNIIRVDNFKK